MATEQRREGHEMKRDIDKEQLTAYALGELSGEAAREVELLIAGDEITRRYVEEARALARFAERDLRNEPLGPGQGSTPILAEIARRNAERLPARRVWIQALSIGAVIVLFTLAFPLRRQFSGNVARLFSGTPAPNDAVEEEILTHRKTKDSAAVVVADLAEFQARGRQAHHTEHCRLELPVATAADSITSGTGAITARYFLPGTGLKVEILLHERLSPLVHEVGVEEVWRESGRTLYRQLRGTSRVLYFSVPEKASAEYCEVEVSSSWAASEELIMEFSTALDQLARSLAGSAFAEERY